MTKQDMLLNTRLRSEDYIYRLWIQQPRSNGKK
jgi:hypothetical protein